MAPHRGQTASPQSNQRGIETELSGKLDVQHVAGLNRTSVGLKRSRGCSWKRWYAWPQSNQRGIETEIPGADGSPQFRAPQSNQRGIETGLGGDVLRDLLHEPQSNQRGIETRLVHPHAEGQRRLNRTSVGLKPLTGKVEVVGKLGLNRTSVGLKPSVVQAEPVNGLWASIEPAWD